MNSHLIIAFWIAVVSAIIGVVIWLVKKWPLLGSTPDPVILAAARASTPKTYRSVSIRITDSMSPDMRKKLEESRRKPVDESDLLPDNFLMDEGVIVNSGLFSIRLKNNMTTIGRYATDDSVASSNYDDSGSGSSDSSSSSSSSSD